MTLQEYIESEKNKGIDISYSSIARLVPCHISYIGKIIKGEKIPSYMMARRIEQITNGAVKRTNWYPKDDE